MSQAALLLEQISVCYEKAKNRNFVLENFSMRVEKGRVACLLGQSGSGKTTVLRAIAGFEPVMHGTISIDGCCVSSPQHHIAPERRQIGMVFQDYALFPHMDAFHNIAFGLRKKPKAEIEARVMQLLHLVGLETMTKRYPHELSGGQQQRIALARALAPQPSILLLDEPLSSLDGASRKRLGQDVRDILQETGQSALLVTHSMAEARLMADDIFDTLFTSKD